MFGNITERYISCKLWTARAIYDFQTLSWKYANKTMIIFKRCIFWYVILGCPLEANISIDYTAVYPIDWTLYNHRCKDLISHIMLLLLKINTENFSVGFNIFFHLDFDFLRDFFQLWEFFQGGRKARKFASNLRLNSLRIFFLIIDLWFSLLKCECLYI